MNSKQCACMNGDRQCEHPARARGWCKSHYSRWYDTGSTNESIPLGVYGSPCGTNAGAQRHYRKGEVPCESCRIAYNLYQTTRKQRDQPREALLASQNGCCAICGTENPGANGWHLDHDHTCCSKKNQSCEKCRRGMLCGSCNWGLGQFKDSPEILRAAANYLEARRPSI